MRNAGGFIPRFNTSPSGARTILVSGESQSYEILNYRKAMMTKIHENNEPGRADIFFYSTELCILIHFMEL
jgi:hypothetical protein